MKHIVTTAVLLVLMGSSAMAATHRGGIDACEDGQQADRACWPDQKDFSAAISALNPGPVAVERGPIRDRRGKLVGPEDGYNNIHNYLFRGGIPY
jgi:hypothetical protein